MKPGDLARASQHELDYQGRTSLFWSKAFRLNEDVDGGNRFVTSVGIVSIRQIKLYWRKNPGSKAKDKVVEEFIIHNTNRHLEEDIEDYRMFFMSILVGGMRGGSAVEFICSRPERSLEAGRFELDLDDFSKDEFGGRSSTSGRVNFGNEYEEKLAETYYKMSIGMNIEKEPWAKHVNQMNKRFQEDTNCSLSYCHWAGPQNTSRPLVELNGGKSIAISSGGKTDGKIGETVQDIMVQYGGDAKKYPSSNAKGSKIAKPDPNAPYTFYISVKYGKTLAFFNCGVQGTRGGTPLFPTSDMEKGTIPKAGKTLLDMFNIEEKPFVDIFKNFGKGGSGLSPYKFNTKLTTKQQTALEKMIYTGVGHGYYMAHFIQGRFEFYEVTEQYCKSASTLSGSTVELQYGGGDGKSKRINMVFSTNKYDFSFNIRNKQGAVYPSHTNGDYVLNVSAPSR